MELRNGIKTFSAKSRAVWRKWFMKNHQSEKSVWLVIYKKDSGAPSIYYPEAVEEALCFGWIDSKANKRDKESYFQFFAKRNPKSKWSKINKDRVAGLIDKGLMTPAGLELIELAKENGAWNALDDVENITIPPDMEKALTKNKKAFRNWNVFPRSSKRGILEWIMNAKRPETRQKRITETITLAAQNIRANLYQKRN